jgi:hypothetical protein
MKVTPNEIGDAVQEAELQDDHTQAATLAEARERELLDAMGLLEGIADSLKAERAQMIAELRGLMRYQDNCSGDESFMQADRRGEYIEFCEVKAIINKYEALK